MSTTAELEGLLGRLRQTNVDAGLDLRLFDYLLGFVLLNGIFL